MGARQLVVDIEIDDEPDVDDEQTVMCDRCRLDWPIDDVEVVEFTELEEQWCSDCRERRSP